MEHEIFSPDRLRLARQRRGLRMQELAARVGVTPRTVSRWESGERTPDRDNLQELSRELKFPERFFFGDSPPMLEGWAFRSMARLTARQRDKALAAGAQAIAFDQWLDDLIERPQAHVPDLRGLDPEEAAVSLRAQWGLGFRPLPNLVHLLEANGARVYSLLHDGIEVDAFSVWHGGVPFVFLNTSVTPERSRMDVAHETGHLGLHAHTGGGETKAENDEANQFAAAFLMPKEPFIASAPRKVTVASVTEAKQRWGVSALAYVRRMYTLGRLSEWQYRSLCIEIRTKYRSTEPGPARRPETSKVLAWVFSPESGISRTDAARDLQIPLSDLDDMTFGLALTAVAGAGGESSPRSKTRPPDLKLVK